MCTNGFGTCGGRLKAERPAAARRYIDGKAIKPGELTAVLETIIRPDDSGVPSSSDVA
jgi:hypothetical protein